MADSSSDDILRYAPSELPVPTTTKTLKSCDTLKLYIGPKRKRYVVHKALLTRYEWFRKKIFCPALSPSISLSEEDPKAFELLIGWLYRKTVNEISTADESVAKEEVTLYVDLYLRAYEWDMHELQNALMDRMRARTTCVYGYFPRALIKKIYECTKSLSPLRSYIVDSFIYKGIQWDEQATISWTRTTALKSQLDAGNHLFVLDCYEALFQLCAKSKIREPDRRTGCAYHTHKEGETCRK